MRPVILAPFGPPALACIRSWGEQGWEPGFICIQSSFSSAPSSRYLVDWVRLPREDLFKESGIEVIVKFLTSFHADGICCINEDVSIWLNENKNKFPDNVSCWTVESDILLEISSKKKQIEVAKSVGFSVLPTYYLGAGVRDDIPEENFPLCLRPTLPESIKPDFKVRVVYSDDEINKMLSSAEYIKSPIVAQPFMDLPNIVVHGSRDIHGSVLFLQAFIVDRKFEGFALTVSPVDIDKKLKENCAKFADFYKIIGVFHFDIMYDHINNEFYFLELNPRFGGTTAKVYRCGYDEPAMMLCAYGKDINIDRKIEKYTVGSHFALIKYLLYCFLNKRNIVDYPRSEKNIDRILFVLKRFFFIKDDIFIFSDIKGSFSLYKENIFVKLRGFLRRFCSF
ncbi:MAG: hypothetical protein ACOX5Z_06005 [Desulfobulbus sp.]|jgi:hypothetical protein